MFTITDILQPQYAWVILGFCLLFLEFVIPGVITIFFGIGALVVGIICWFADISINLQLTLFMLISIALLLTLRRSFVSWFTKEAWDAGQDSDDFKGQKATVTQTISPAGGGKVEFRGSYWKAESDVAIEAGTAVKIVGKKNITLLVKPI